MEGVFFLIHEFRNKTDMKGDNLLQERERQTDRVCVCVKVRDNLS